MSLWGDLKVHKAFFLWLTNAHDHFTMQNASIHPISPNPRSPNYLVLFKSPSLMSPPRVEASSGVSICRNQNNGTRGCSSWNCLVIGKCTTSPGDMESCRVVRTLSLSISSSRAGQKRIVYPGILYEGVTWVPLGGDTLAVILLTHESKCCLIYGFQN